MMIKSVMMLAMLVGSSYAQTVPSTTSTPSATLSKQIENVLNRANSGRMPTQEKIGILNGLETKYSQIWRRESLV